jgi:hypothetical protein
LLGLTVEADAVLPINGNNNEMTSTIIHTFFTLTNSFSYLQSQYSEETNGKTINKV